MCIKWLSEVALNSLRNVMLTVHWNLWVIPSIQARTELGLQSDAYYFRVSGLAMHVKCFGHTCSYIFTAQAIFFLLCWSLRSIRESHMWLNEINFIVLYSGCATFWIIDLRCYFTFLKCIQNLCFWIQFLGPMDFRPFLGPASSMLLGKKQHLFKYLEKLGVSDICFIVVLVSECILVLTDNGSRICSSFFLVSYKDGKWHTEWHCSVVRSLSFCVVLSSLWFTNLANFRCGTAWEAVIMSFCRSYILLYLTKQIVVQETVTCICVDVYT